MTVSDFKARRQIALAKLLDPQARDENMLACIRLGAKENRLSITTLDFSDVIDTDFRIISGFVARGVAEIVWFGFLRFPDHAKLRNETWSSGFQMGDVG